MSKFVIIKESAETVSKEFRKIDEQVNNAKPHPRFSRQPPFCKAPFPCDDKRVQSYYHHNHWKQPTQVCLFTETCNQRTFDRREAISKIGFATP